MASRQFRTSLVVMLGAFGVLAVFAGFVGGKILQRAVERSSPSPSVAASAAASPSEPTEAPSPSASAHTPPLGFGGPLPGTPITPKGAQLRSAGGKVYALDPENGCESLMKGTGDCGVEDMAASRTAWVSEHWLIPGPADLVFHRVRVLTYSDELNGWVEQLRATDVGEPPWLSARVVVRDLTGDGKPELVVGYHYAGSGQDLGIDIVVNDDGVPRVYHPDDAVHGSVVFEDGNLIQYRAAPDSGDSNCCPSAFLKRTISWDGEDFRVTSTEKVPPGQVPASDL